MYPNSREKNDLSPENQVVHRHSDLILTKLKLEATIRNNQLAINGNFYSLEDLESNPNFLGRYSNKPNPSKKKELSLPEQPHHTPQLRPHPNSNRSD
ncbi:hypothetical protein JTB14_010820 [Gonioctena quinquepunctata]|nr:hypothetical protein JTB14_010820 [Gonioctena quinquepunctata]